MHWTKFTGGAYEDLDAETRKAIERAEEQSARGEGRSWEAVKAELQSK
jgi:hypothetical protein